MTEQDLNGWTEDESKLITQTFVRLAKTLEFNEIPGNVACSALMALSAQYASLTEETDDHIIEQFKKCLFDARTRNQNLTEN